MSRLFSLVVVVLLITSCGGSKKAISSKKNKDTTEKITTSSSTHEEEKPSSRIPKKIDTPAPSGSYADKVNRYISTYADIAKDEMREYGIPASITLAQGILESGAGEGRLTREANNHFGIKCHDWKGATIYHDDDKAQECFRKYSAPQFSFRDHSLFLSGRKRYFSLFKLPKDDFKGWAKGLRAAGYATDKKYPAKLISIINRYKLYTYDAEVLGKDPKIAKKVAKEQDRYTVKGKDTLYSISKKFKISVDELKQINGLESNDIFVGQVIYVQPLPKEF